MILSESDLFPIAQYLRAAAAGQLHWDRSARTYVLHGSHVPKDSTDYQNLMALTVLCLLTSDGEDDGERLDPLRVNLGPTAGDPAAEEFQTRNANGRTIGGADPYDTND